MALEIWDALFSFDPSLELIDAICVAMLIRIRTQLLESDYSSAIQALLNYPSYAVDCAPTTLITQAQQISASPNRLTLMSIMQENEEMLQIPTTVKSEEPLYNSTSSFSSSVPPSLSHLTRGVYAQTLSSGLGRALQNVHKTVNAAYMSHSASNGGSDGFPPLIESVHRAPLPSRDATAELQEIRQRDKLIGGSLVRVIEALEKHWSESVTAENDGLKAEQAKSSDIDFLLCLTTLKHSRDVLMGHTHDFDSAIMDGPKIFQAEEAKEKKSVDDQKAKDFGQRFRRTVEEAIATPSSIAATSSPGSKINSSVTAPPVSVAKPTASQLPARLIKRESVHDPLGVR